MKKRTRVREKDIKMKRVTGISARKPSQATLQTDNPKTTNRLIQKVALIIFGENTEKREDAHRAFTLSLLLMTMAFFLLSITYPEKTVEQNMYHVACLVFSVLWLLSNTKEQQDIILKYCIGFIVLVFAFFFFMLGTNYLLLSDFKNNHYVILTILACIECLISLSCILYIIIRLLRNALRSARKELNGLEDATVKVQKLDDFLTALKSLIGTVVFCLNVIYFIYCLLLKPLL